MKNLRILICGLFFFCTGLVCGQTEYEHFVIDTTELNYYIKWKDYEIDSLKKYDTIFNYERYKVEFFRPLLDSIQHLIIRRVPENVSEIIDFWVAITYSRTGKIVGFFYTLNIKAMHLFPESLLLDISKLLLTLNTDYPILDDIEERWQQPQYNILKRRSGNTTVLLKLYDNR